MIGPRFLLALALVGCTDKGDDSGAGDVVYTDLGNVTTDENGYATVPFTADEGAVSIGVYCGPYGFDTLATADALIDPVGETIFDDENPQYKPMRVETTSDLLPFVIPVSPDLDIMAGAYTLEYYSDTTDAITFPCQTVQRMAAPSGPATVDIDFVFVGVDDDDVAPGMNSSGAESNLNDVLGWMEEDWAGQLVVGNVTYTDFDGDVDEFEVIDNDTEFGTLLRTAEDRRTVTVFFVEEINTDTSANILGLAGGPPGAAALGGTSKSGVVVSMINWLAEDGSGPRNVARALAHETGHFLGLFHTSEKTGDAFDPLSDTPECEDAAQGTSGCDSRGAENVMFWTGGATIVELSADQGWVVQRSAAVQ